MLEVFLMLLYVAHVASKFVFLLIPGLIFWVLDVYSKLKAIQNATAAEERRNAETLDTEAIKRSLVTRIDLLDMLSLKGMSRKFIFIGMVCLAVPTVQQVAVVGAGYLALTNQVSAQIIKTIANNLDSKIANVILPKEKQ